MFINVNSVPDFSARLDNLHYAIALNLTKYLYEEEEYIPWQSALTSFKYFDRMLSQTSTHKEWKVSYFLYIYMFLID